MTIGCQHWIVWESAHGRGVHQPSIVVGSFHNPDFDAVIACIPSCQGPGNPAKYPVTTLVSLRSQFVRTQTGRPQPAERHSAGTGPAAPSIRPASSIGLAMILRTMATRRGLYSLNKGITFAANSSSES